MSNFKLTFLLSYFNQSKVLEKHIDIWNNYSNKLKEQICFQIIDDCSLKNHAKPIIDKLDTNSLNLNLFKE